MASKAARELGKYREYAALLFTNQKSLELENLKQYASQLGLDRKKFDTALDSGKFAPKVKRDLADGDKIGVDSTPSLFINGKRTRERSKEALRAAIETALKDSGKSNSGDRSNNNQIISLAALPLPFASAYPAHP